MKKRLIAVATLLVLAFSSVIQSQPRVDATKPNIVFILVDKVEYGELETVSAYSARYA